MKGAYEEIATHFSQTRAAPWESFKQIALEIHSGDRVLDLGCGNGRFFDFLQTNCDLYYTGLDQSPQLLTIARKRYGESKHCAWVEGNLLHLPFPDSSFDAVTAIASLYHIPSSAFRQRALNEIARVLKPGGRAAVTNWNLWQRRFWLHHLAAWPKILVRSADLGDCWIPWKSPDRRVQTHRYGHAFRPAELRRLAQRADLRVEHCHYDRKGQRSSWLHGANLLLYAKKISL